jgi:aspartate 1-decarboxylase
VTLAVQDTLTVHRRHLTPGTEVKIEGVRGRFRFQRYVVNEQTGAEWIDVYGGTAGHETIRSFRPDRVSTVHRKKVMR